MLRRSPRLPLALAAVAAIGGLIMAAVPAAAAPGGTERVRVILQLKDKASQDAVVASVGNQAAKVRTTKTLPYVVMEVPRAALDGLRRNPRVVTVNEDLPEAPTLDSTIPVINGDDVVDLGFDGGGAAVAILDTGIDADHPFFAGRIVGQACFSDPNDDDGDNAEESLCVNGNTTDTTADVETGRCLDGGTNLCDHGSNVAGIAAGSEASDAANAPGNGVAPGADVVAVQVFTRFNNAGDCSPNAAPCVLTYPSDQIFGLDWVRTNNALNSWNVAAVNMSLGGGMNGAACDADSRKGAIDNLLAAGIATTIASGNNSFLNAVGAPGCISTAFTVGRTNDDDTTTNSGNRGGLLDVMAPGSSVNSSVPDDSYGSMSGTSMSAPHVAGALAVLRDAYPARSITDLMNDITSTGVPITYSTAADGSSTRTTPRLDLLAALQAPNTPPGLTADEASVTVDEGSPAANTGTYSDDGTVTAISADLGTVTFAAGTWSWSHTPTDDTNGTVTITATDDKGETGTTDFQFTATNVAPTVTVTSVSDAAENGSTTVSATFTDPGSADTHDVWVDWGDGNGFVDATDDTSPTSAAHTYGDDGSFTVTVRVTDDDAGVGTDTGTAQVSNVDPTATIDESGATTWNGQTIFFVEAGTPATFEGNGTDPGSDDLTFAWDFGDGGGDINVHLVNPPATDADPSPDVDPRDVDDSTTHTFDEACARTLGLAVSDDDSGSDDDSAQVIVLGTSDDARGHGFWQSEYRGTKKPVYTNAEKTCLLSVVRVLSDVYDEERNLTTLADGAKVLYLKRNAPPRDVFDAHLLTLWLNVANGAIALNHPVDTDGDTVADTTVGDLLTEAEDERTGASPDDAQLLWFKNLFQMLNESL